MRTDYPTVLEEPRQLTEMATLRLRNSPHQPLRRISCECSDDYVLLGGTLPSFYYKQLAQETIADLAAGCQIVNNIVVSYPA